MNLVILKNKCLSFKFNIITYWWGVMTTVKTYITVLFIGILMVLFLQMPVSASLADAVDNTNLVWTTGGDANWFGESSTWYYDTDAAESGDIGNSYSNYLGTTVTGPGTLSFWWKVSSESSNDYLNIYIDGVRMTRISGEVDWQQRTYSLSAGAHTLEWRYSKNSATSRGSDCGWVDKVEFTPAETTPPGTVTYLHNTTHVQNAITWAWTDPTDADFSRVMVYLNNVFRTNVTKGVQTYTGTGLTAGTQYTISTRTVDTSGNVNPTWVNHTAWTAPQPPDRTPPRSVTGLNNTTYAKDFITWDWTDPADSDFARVMVYLDGVYKGDVTRGTHTYNATGLANNTAYTIGTRTVDTSGNVNQTWVNHTARTGSSGIRNLVVSFIDVGYGDSILIESPSGKTMLIDAGYESKGDNVEEYLLGRGISALDIAMVTHPHPDHFGGMERILNNFEVYQYIDNGQTGNGYASAVLDIVEEQGIPYKRVKSGDIIFLDSLLQIQVLNPQSTLFGDTNDDSLALKLVYNQDSFLLMADAMSKAENKMISSQTNLNTDILKVGHHGDKDGTSSTFLSYVTPERSIISVGTNDSGLPSSTLLSRLSAIGSSIYRTDKVDNVVITSNGLQYTVKTG